MNCRKKIFLELSFFIVFSFACFNQFALADQMKRREIYLKNGDRISGTIIGESEEEVILDSEVLGKVKIPRDSIRQMPQDILMPARGPQEKPKLWKREISIGYDKESGNTNRSELAAKLLFNRKTKLNEFTLKGSAFYATADKKMDAQRWDAMIRYALSFGKELAWYRFYKFQADHDWFANIDYRLVPSVGIGYWFSDTDDWKALSELGLGFERINYRDQAKARNEVVLIPRVFLEKKLIADSRISQELILYPSLNYPGEYRIHSSDSFKQPFI